MRDATLCRMILRKMGSRINTSDILRDDAFKGAFVFAKAPKKLVLGGSIA